MTESRTIKNPSALVLAVLALDEHFSEMKRLAGRIDDIELKSDFDYEQCEKLVHRFAEVGQAVSSDIVLFVNELNEAKAQAELAAEKVAAKSEKLKVRSEDIKEKLSRFEVLSRKVSQLNETLTGFRPSASQELSDAEKTELKNRLVSIRGQLDEFIDEAEELKDLGHQSKIKILEQNADSMRQSLIAANKKIESLDI